MDVRAGQWKRLSAKEMMPSNYGAREDSWESLDSKEFKPINPKGNQPWLFTERTVAEAPILWPTDAESWLTGKDWRQKEKGMSEDKMIEWHHWLNGHEFEQTSRDSEGQGSLVSCSSWGCKELDMTYFWITTITLLKKNFYIHPSILLSSVCYTVGSCNYLLHI